MTSMQYTPLTPTFFKSQTMPEMEQTMIITKEMQKMRDSLFWGVFNVVILAIIVYDIVYTCPFYSPTAHMIEHAIAVILVLNTLFHFCRYFWTSLTLQPVALSPRQKTLLGIKDSDYYYFKTATSTPVKATPPVYDSPTTPLNMSTNSWLSSSVVSHCGDPNESVMSSNLNTSCSSWLYQNKTSPSLAYETSILPNSEIIRDETSLQQYLREYETFEKSSVVETSMEQPSNMLSAFWNHPASRTTTEVSPLLRRCTYQMSVSPAQAQSGVGSGDETGSPSSYQHADVWRRTKINPVVLTEWTANLRMWISQTILERLVSEIKHVDTSLHAQGLVDITVGMVGLERLKKTAQIPQVMLNVPSLARLVPFLEISQNQDYIVARIKELARGGCMSEYRWSSGGMWEGKEWTPALPTDTALVLHMLATYLDSQLPQTSLPDTRPFTSQHLVKMPNKPHLGQLCIVETSSQPPNYLLQTKTDTYHTPKGRNNLFFTILLFLHTVKTKEHGILGRINLGRSGANNPHETLINIISHNSSVKHSKTESKSKEDTTQQNYGYTMLEFIINKNRLISEHRQFIGTELQLHFKCTLCEKTINYTKNDVELEQNLLAHINSTLHCKNTKATSILQMFKEINGDRDGKHCFHVLNGAINCVQCKCSILSDVELLLKHCQDDVNVKSRQLLNNKECAGSSTDKPFATKVNSNKSPLHKNSVPDITPKASSHSQQNMSQTGRPKNTKEIRKSVVKELLRPLYNQFGKITCIAENENGNLTCLVCNCCIQPSTHCVKMHITGKFHKNKIQCQIKELSTINVDNGEQHGVVLGLDCNNGESRDLYNGLIEHLFESLPQRFQEDKVYFTINLTDGSLNCTLCDSTMEPTVIEDHLKEKVHLKQKLLKTIN